MPFAEARACYWRQPCGSLQSAVQRAQAAATAVEFGYRGCASSIAIALSFRDIHGRQFAVKRARCQLVDLLSDLFSAWMNSGSGMVGLRQDPALRVQQGDHAGVIELAVGQLLVLHAQHGREWTHAGGSDPGGALAAPYWSRFFGISMPSLTPTRRGDFRVSRRHHPHTRSGHGDPKCAAACFAPHGLSAATHTPARPPRRLPPSSACPGVRSSPRRPPSS